MRKLSHRLPHHSTTINYERRPGDRPLTRRQLSPELLSDAVVAGYIHEISARHGWDPSGGTDASQVPDEPGDVFLGRLSDTAP